MERVIERTVSMKYLRRVVDYVDTEMYVGDKRSHKWIIKVINPGMVGFNLNGATVNAYSIRSDGISVISAGSASGNTVEVTFSEACYHVPGQLRCLCKIILNDVEMVLDAFYTTVNESETTSIVDPDEHIISVEELIALVANKEDKGHLTIGSERFTMRISNTDAGEQGYFTFVPEATT